MQVELSNINFRYPTRKDIVALEDVTLKLEPGKLVALVGLSGSGKSTLVALLQRLYDPDSGQVRPLLLYSTLHILSFLLSWGGRNEHTTRVGDLDDDLQGGSVSM